MIRFLEYVDLWPIRSRAQQLELPMWVSTASPGDVGLILEESETTLEVLIGNETFCVGKATVHEKCERLF